MNKKDRIIIETNYRKLWLLERTNEPFRYTISLLRKKWQYLLFTADLKKTPKKALQEQREHLKRQLKTADRTFFPSIAPIINIISKMNLPEETKKHIYEINLEKSSSNIFFDDIANLAIEFSFEEFWEPCLMIYFLTGKIFSPDKPSKVAPGERALQYERIFAWTLRKDMDHEKPDYDKNNNDFIHSNTNIADKVYGKEDWDKMTDAKMQKVENKRDQNIRQGVTRFRKYLTPLTPQKKRRLQKIFM